MVGGRSTVVSSHRSPLLFPFVTLCLMHAARGGPVTQLKFDWLFPWNISCSTCGKSFNTTIESINKYS